MLDEGRGGVQITDIEHHKGCCYHWAISQTLVVHLFLVCFRVYNRMNWKERDTSFTIMSLYILFLFFSNRGKDAIFPQLIMTIMKHSTQYGQDTKVAVGEEWNGPFHHPIPLKSRKWRNGRVSSFLSPFLPTQNKLVVS